MNVHRPFQMLRTKHDPKVHGTWHILNLLFDDQTEDSLEILLYGLQWCLQKVQLVAHPVNMKRKKIIKMPSIWYSYRFLHDVERLCKKGLVISLKQNQKSWFELKSRIVPFLLPSFTVQGGSQRGASGAMAPPIFWPCLASKVPKKQLKEHKASSLEQTKFRDKANIQGDVSIQDEA